jgi:hypothetical protein
VEFVEVGGKITRGSRLDGKRWRSWTVVTAQLPTHIGGKEKEMKING